MAQVPADTVKPDGRKGYHRIEVIQCPCDSLKDSLVACFDTASTLIWHWSVLDIVDSLSVVYGIPEGLVYEIGKNESGWPQMHNPTFLIKYGDLQVMDRTYDIMYKRLGLNGGKTRYNYLVVGVAYLKYNYDIYGSWKKARYAYGRGQWKSPKYWTALERKFMGKIDWSRYD